MEAQNYSSASPTQSQTPAEKTQPKFLSKLKRALRRLEIALLSIYYGNPSKDLKLIVVAGEQHTANTAHFIHEILKLADQKAGLILDLKTPASYYRKLSKIWREGANHVVISTSALGIANQNFHKSHIQTLIITDTTDANPNTTALYQTLTAAQPDYIILNQEDPSFPLLSEGHALKALVSYGPSHTADVRINRANIYRQGTEVNIFANGQFNDYASFISSEDVVMDIAAAVTAALTMSYSTDNIIEGITNYEP